MPKPDTLFLMAAAALTGALLWGGPATGEPEPKDQESEETDGKRTFRLTPELVERLAEEGKLDPEQAKRILEKLRSGASGEEGDEKAQKKEKSGGMRVTFGGAVGEDIPTLEVGQAAPPLSFKHVLENRPEWMAESGAPSWEALRGKAVVLEFWATWCGPCVAAMPHLNEMAMELADEDVVFLSISNESPETITEFLSDREMETIVASDPDSTTNTAYGVTSIPRTVLVGPEGRIAAMTHPTMVTTDAIRAVLAGEPVDLAAPQSQQTVIRLKEPVDPEELEEFESQPSEGDQD